jgi:hypothetical protein
MYERLILSWGHHCGYNAVVEFTSTYEIIPHHHSYTLWGVFDTLYDKYLSIIPFDVNMLVILFWLVALILLPLVGLNFLLTVINILWHCGIQPSGTIAFPWGCHWHYTLQHLKSNKHKKLCYTSLHPCFYYTN